ncbi:MAG TPA: carbohydrate-binding family 9-like protein [Planctomycetota bacterium]|nr:carbohydrate-binding family 9-like protein [Planctomycetota bacterium]
MIRTLRAVTPLLLGLGACAHESSTPAAPSAPEGSRPTLRVHSTEDFEVTGNGSNAAWGKAEWVPLNRRQADGHPYESRFKVLYSRKGIYILFDGTDRKLTTTGRGDFEDLWQEDVYEAFFWTDESWPLYFEYEISPLNHELPILVPNNGGAFMGWRPWHYEGERKTRKATAVTGGPKEAGAAVSGWSAEIFIPFALLHGLKNQVAGPGTRWRANFYRMDHDDKKTTQWDWARVGPSFHEYQNFGVLFFE